MSTVRRRRGTREAFTLIELLLVLVILAVLASIVVLNFGSIFGQSDETKAKVDIATLGTALDMYRANVKSYPQSLDALVTNTENQPDWKGPYVQKGLPSDPWHHAYVYVFPGQHNPDSYDLSSNGDGKHATENLDNWSVEAKK
ncbi:MAG TPA: type II secretion system major pseudopilin GspG [Tepidisphaeraceae bacterium]|jgi:general secretion pathway protein G|nr:type II secretion system major pseudopilin GspG [Tepidisphaeraceae bacterium]